LPEERDATVHYYNEVIDLALDLGAQKVLYINGNSFRMLRLAYFPESGHTLVGLMCRSPEREGFEVEFSELQIGEPIRTGLHD
jgi:uncharacterized protein